MFKTNITYGLIVLIPVAIIVLLLAKIVEVLKLICKPLGLESLTGTAVLSESNSSAGVVESVGKG